LRRPKVFSRSHLTVLTLLPSRRSRSAPVRASRSKGRVRESFRGVRVERGDRGGLERDVPDALPLAVDEVHLRGAVLAIPDDGGDRDAIGAGIPDTPEGVVVDDGLDEVVKRRYVGDRDGEVPDRRLVDGLLHEHFSSFTFHSL